MTARQPAEWTPHRAMWTAWPSDASLWLDDLASAQGEVAAMVFAIADGGEHVHMLADGADALESAAEAMDEHRNVTIHPTKFGDIWLRDTGPLFLDNGSAAAFRFNGWGGKYVLDGDDAVAGYIARAAGKPLKENDWVLEGGAIDVDGTGRVLTTRQCLLNPNRNPGMDEADVERRLAEDLGLTQVIWLGDGLMNDHTDGHVDNLARFVSEGVVAVPQADGADDPNRFVFDAAAKAIQDAGLELVRVPSVGYLADEDGKAVPASYMNFLITNTRVIVPVYGQINDAAAVKAIGALFPGREAVGLRADHILTGGGSFHCITQQVPTL